MMGAVIPAAPPGSGAHCLGDSPDPGLTRRIKPRDKAARARVPANHTDLRMSTASSNLVQHLLQAIDVGQLNPGDVTYEPDLVARFWLTPGAVGARFGVKSLGRRIRL